MTVTEDPIGPHRERLLGLAYRMLGSFVDAEDVLQDAYLRFAGADQEAIRSAEAYLVRIVTRLCLDRLKSARAQREIYVGPWLPEPVTDVEPVTPETAAELADDLSFALMLTLERLSGPERAAFLLHDVFDAPYSEVATALGKSEPACRQLAARARKAVRKERPERHADAREHKLLLSSFIEAAASGDVSRLRTLLADEVIAYSDGGGVKAAALNPIFGADKVARFFNGVIRKSAARSEEITFQFTTLNGLPGLLVFVNGDLDHSLSIDVTDQRISTIYTVRNPEKHAGVRLN